MNPIMQESESVTDLTDEELELVSGGATFTKQCQIKKDGTGWCFLKED